MLSYPDRRWSRNTFIYMLVLAIYFAINFSVNMIWKDPRFGGRRIDIHSEDILLYHCFARLCDDFPSYRRK